MLLSKFDFVHAMCTHLTVDSNLTYFTYRHN